MHSHSVLFLSVDPSSHQFPICHINIICTDGSSLSTHHQSLWNSSSSFVVSSFASIPNSQVDTPMVRQPYSSAKTLLVSVKKKHPSLYRQRYFSSICVNHLRYCTEIYIYIFFFTVSLEERECINHFLFACSVFIRILCRFISFPWNFKTSRFYS